jgi:hypothetical protein
MTQDQAALMPEVVTWEQLTRQPRWESAYQAARPDDDAATALAHVEPGAEVTIVLASWCGDSLREVSRLMRALHHAQVVPFSLRMLDVQRSFRDDPAMQALDIRFVPTIIVRREGHEVGRIVESAPRGVERELGDLLRGDAAGVISGRDDL